MNYYRHIDRNKIQFDFICDADSTNIPKDEIESLGGKVIICPPYQKVFKYIKFLEKLFKENKYKIVHSNINSLSVFPLYAAKRAKVPIRIAHSHSTANKKELKKTLIKNMLRPFSRMYANVYFACSELAGRWLFGNRTFDKGKVTIINNAIDVGKFIYNEEVRKKVRNKLNIELQNNIKQSIICDKNVENDVTNKDYDTNKDNLKIEKSTNENNKKVEINDSTLIVGNVGRFVKQKNHTFLIDIFNEIHKRNSNSILILAGQGPLMEEVKAKVNELGLKNYVMFLGQRNDANELYQAMDVFLLPSLYEGLPLVGVEAQAAGLLCELSSSMTKETKILSTTNFIDIEMPAKKWAEKVLLDYKNFTRKNSSKEFENNGFEIKREAKKLEEKYLVLLKSF